MTITSARSSGTVTWLDRAGSSSRMGTGTDADRQLCPGCLDRCGDGRDAVHDEVLRRSAALDLQATAHRAIERIESTRRHGDIRHRGESALPGLAASRAVE